MVGYQMSDKICDTSLNLPKPLCIKAFREVRYVVDTSLAPHLTPLTSYLLPLPSYLTSGEVYVRSK